MDQSHPYQKGVDGVIPDETQRVQQYQQTLTFVSSENITIWCYRPDPNNLAAADSLL